MLNLRLRLFSKKLLPVTALLLSVVMLVNLLAACGKNEGSSETPQAAILEKLSADLSLFYAFDEGAGENATERISKKSNYINYIFNQANQSLLYKPSSDPQWRKNGVKNGALLFDGFSTHIEDADFKMPKDAFTINVWVAPRAFENTDYNKLVTIIGKGVTDEEAEVGSREGFTFGLGRLGTWGLQIALEDENASENAVKTVYFMDNENLLPALEWSMLSVSYNCVEARVTMYLNGEPVFEDIRPELKNNKIVASAENLLIGKYSNPTNVHFDTNYFCGILDELAVYNKELSKKDVKNMYLEYTGGTHPQLAWDDIRIDESVYAGDRYRPQYHSLPAGIWMNEPHAPMYFNGKFHLFYQHNPIGPYWRQIRWAHWVSDDMINWEYVKDAVSMSPGVAPEGLWTGGSTFDLNGNPILFVTAGTNAGGMYSGQNVAYARPADSADPYLTDWVIDSTLAIAQDQTMGRQGQFRDPFVWKDGDTYYMMICNSAGDKDGDGRNLIFTSTDLIEWTNHGFVFTPASGYEDIIGMNWECSILLPIKSENGITKYVYFICPQYVDNSVHTIEGWYWVGSFNKSTMRFIPDHPEPKLMDYGNGIYTGQTGFCYLTDEQHAQGLSYEDGRSVIFAIAQGKEGGSEHMRYSGWAHNGTMPLELWLDNDGVTLKMAPIEEYKSLRTETLISTAGSIASVNETIKDIRGDTLEINMTVRVNSAITENASFGLDFRYNKNGNDVKKEYTRFMYHKNGAESGFKVERTYSSYFNVNDTRLRNFEINEAMTFDIKILLDRSMVEIYVNDSFSFSTHAYPKYEDSDYLRLFSENCNVTVIKFDVYRLGAVYQRAAGPAFYGNTGSILD